MTEEVKVQFGADASGAVTGSKQAADSVTQATVQIKNSMSDMNSHMSSQMKSMQDAFTGGFGKMMDVGKQFGALLAGALSVGAMKSAVDMAISYNASVLSLARVMGMTTSEASTLGIAIKIIGGTTEEYAAMNMRLGMHIKSNADALEQLGVKIKDGNGDLLSQKEIFDNAISAMSQYKEGADRNQFALYAFGRGAAEVYKYLNLTQTVMAQATDIASKYGLVIGDQAAAQTKQMSYQLNILGIIFDAVKVQVGNEILPTLVNFAGTLGEIASIVIPLLVGAVKGLLTAFESLVLGFKIAGAVMLGTLSSISAILSAVVTAVQRVIKGDFGGAWQALKDGAADVKDNFRATWDVIIADATKTSDRLKNIWMPTAATAPTSTTPKGTKSFVDPDKGKEKEDPSRMGAWRDALEQQKMDEKAYFDFSTEQEKAYWQGKLALTKAGSRERFEVNHVIFELEKKDIQDYMVSQEKQIDTEMKIAEKSAATKQHSIDQKYAMGEISATEQIQQEQALYNELYKVQMDGLAKAAEIAQQYPKVWEKVHQQIQLLTQAHNDQMTKLNDKLAIENKKTWDKLLSPIQSAISTSIKGMIMGTTTLQKAVSNLAQSILASFVDLGVKELTQWTTTQLAKLNISQMFSQAMVALGITTEAEKTAVETPAAVASIEKNAAVAASGAAASQASIPWVGPALAVAAAAAMLAMVLGFKSFEVGGWVPNTGMAMLHENELVLKPNEAQAVMSGGKGSGGNITIQAWDSKDIGKFMKKHGNALMAGLKGPVRDFNSGAIRRA